MHTSRSVMGEQCLASARHTWPQGCRRRSPCRGDAVGVHLVAAGVLAAGAWGQSSGVGRAFHSCTSQRIWPRRFEPAPIAGSRCSVDLAGLGRRGWRPPSRPVDTARELLCLDTRWSAYQRELLLSLADTANTRDAVLRGASGATANDAVRSWTRSGMRADQRLEDQIATA